MSPGPTFDRVYASLKDHLLGGRWPPGAHLEPAVIGGDLHASITPVRDALHRLVGERLVDAPRHDGFWVPAVTETQLRDLYAWSGELVSVALRRQRPAPARFGWTFETDDPAAVFIALGRGAGSLELERAIAASNDRLAAFRTIESEVLHGVADELAHIDQCARAAEIGSLRRALATYHRRRQRAAPLILGARHRGAA